VYKIYQFAANKWFVYAFANNKKASKLAFDVAKAITFINALIFLSFFRSPKRKSGKNHAKFL
jgi:hypothetical protein